MIIKFDIIKLVGGYRGEQLIACCDTDEEALKKRDELEKLSPQDLFIIRDIPLVGDAAVKSAEAAAR